MRVKPKLPVQHYEHLAAGDLLHLDIKKLGRWEHVHVAIDDYSRIASSAIYPDETQASALAFLTTALAYYARLGIRFTDVLTGKGPAYRSRAFASRAAGCVSSTGSPGRTHRAPTARLNDSSRRRYANGPYARSYQNSKRTQPGAPLLVAPVQLASTS